MHIVICRETKAFYRTETTDLFDKEDYLINPDLTAVKGAPKRYWIITGDKITLDKAGYDLWQKRQFAVNVKKDRAPAKPKMKSWFWQRWWRKVKWLVMSK